MTTFIVKSSAAKMPTSCWGKYRRVAVLEVQDGIESVSMISEHARGVVRVVRTWEKLNVGLGIRDAFSRAMNEAEELCAELIEKQEPRHQLFRVVSTLTSVLRTMRGATRMTKRVRCMSDVKPCLPRIPPRQHYLGACAGPNCNGDEDVVWVWGCLNSKTIFCKHCEDVIHIAEDGRCFGDGTGNEGECRGAIRRSHEPHLTRVECTSCHRSVAWLEE